VSADAAVRVGGRRVPLPCSVRDASQGSALFAVRAAEAAPWLPRGGALALAEPWPGRALLALAFVDYRDNDLGDYREVSVALLVRPPDGRRGWRGRARDAADLARGRLWTWIHRLPVDQAFSCEAGREVWGFPKTVERIDLELAPRSARARLEADGRLVLGLELPRGGGRTLRESEQTACTRLGGVVHRTRFRMAGEGFGVAPGRRARLELGPHPWADELRRLGLPRRPLVCTWTERWRARFEGPEPLSAGESPAPPRARRARPPARRP